jgi:hypothetical protein
MKRGIQCPELGRDQLPLLPLYVALVQRVEADGWDLNSQTEIQPAAEAQHWAKVRIEPTKVAPGARHLIDAMIERTTP